MGQCQLLDERGCCTTRREPAEHMERILCIDGTIKERSYSHVHFQDVEQANPPNSVQISEKRYAPLEPSTNTNVPQIFIEQPSNHLPTAQTTNPSRTYLQPSDKLVHDGGSLQARFDLDIVSEPPFSSNESGIEEAVVSTQSTGGKEQRTKKFKRIFCPHFISKGIMGQCQLLDERGCCTTRREPAEHMERILCIDGTIKERSYSHVHFQDVEQANPPNSVQISEKRYAPLEPSTNTNVPQIFIEQPSNHLPTAQTTNPSRTYLQPSDKLVHDGGSLQARFDLDIVSEPPFSSNESGIETLSEEDETFCLVRNFYGISDMNLEGLKRAGSTTICPETLEPLYQNMDSISMCYPLSSVQPNISLFCVFDGHGGMECSRKLSEIFPVVFEQVLGTTSLSCNLSHVFLQSYVLADKKISSLLFQGSMATTVAVWRLPGSNDRYLQVANLGNSMAYLLNDGACIPLTVSHEIIIPFDSDLATGGTKDVVLDETSKDKKGTALRAFGDFGSKSSSVTLSGPHISEPILVTSTVETLILASDGVCFCYGM
eukprot:TRINITY_DN7794_c0_g1_i5.p1 TRINITY_DN7794_c0_g1~~TRINITY_DN7794_c0_g1_i5.p1  ORF type:complete len:544 (+),score=113.93 TRINITY_DN7794_c0_g1_i5:127-1758(+)